MKQPPGKLRKVLKKFLRSLLLPGFGLLMVLKSIAWISDGKIPNLLEAFTEDRSHRESRREREFREQLMVERQLSPVSFWIAGTVYITGGALLLLLGISDWIEPWYRRKQDRRFYDSLGTEDTTSKCRRSDCQSGTVRNSHFCKRHFFERHTGRECPFEH